jgi:hypothetical protein
MIRVRAQAVLDYFFGPPIPPIPPIPPSPTVRLAPLSAHERCLKRLAIDRRRPLSRIGAPWRKSRTEARIAARNEGRKARKQVKRKQLAAELQRLTARLGRLGTR